MGAMEVTFCLMLDKYNLFFKTCIGLTNFHISILPLHCEDGKFEKNYKRCLINEAVQAEKKRKAKLDQNRATKKARSALVTRTFEDDGHIMDIGDSDEWLHSDQAKD